MDLFRFSSVSIFPLNYRRAYNCCPVLIANNDAREDSRSLSRPSIRPIAIAIRTAYAPTYVALAKEGKGAKQRASHNDVVMCSRMVSAR